MNQRQRCGGNGLVFLGLLVLVVVGAWGCADDGEVALTGESAFDFMRKDFTSAPKTDVESIKKVMDWAIDDALSTGSARKKILSDEIDAERAAPGAETIKLLKKTVIPRKNLDPTKYVRFSFEEWAASAPEGSMRRKDSSDNVNLDALQEEFYIDNLDAIPVRNQGYRGTCAAFTGIGHLEYTVLGKYPQLGTIDLSEQRFYYLSKPDCQDTGGCSTDEQGSWYGTGFSASDGSDDLDIPTETDCPYNASLGENDVQTPQLSSCTNGAVRILGLEYATTPQEIVDRLESEGLPVPYASPLSGNWERNSGLITLADSDQSGDTSHAPGHAYLIVGYKKLPNMPEEGGMCFIIKNSWGTGWGVNGFSCMTLAWVQHWTFGYYLSQPLIMDVEIREDLLETGVENNEEAEDEMPPDVPDETELPPENEDGVIEDETPVEDPEPVVDPTDEEEEVIPEPEPEPTISWSEAKLFGPNESYYRAQTATQNGQKLVRAVIRSDAEFTNALALDPVSGSDVLQFDGDDVGELSSSGELYLCSGAYAMLCSLRFEPERNEIYIEFPRPYMRRVKDDEMPDGEWKEFPIPFNDGYDFEYLEPDNLTWVLTNPRAFVRMKGEEDNQPTEPTRLFFKGTKIKMMGEEVGDLNPTSFGLCTGNYRSACSIFGSKDKMEVLPSW